MRFLFIAVVNSFTLGKILPKFFSTHPNPKPANEPDKTSRHNEDGRL